MSKTKKLKFNSSYLFVLPYASIFLVFIVLLLLISFLLSFTYYDSVNMPTFVGLKNYITLFTQDTDFMQYALPNTIPSNTTEIADPYPISIRLNA